MMMLRYNAVDLCADQHHRWTNRRLHLSQHADDAGGAMRHFRYDGSPRTKVPQLLPPVTLDACLQRRRGPGSQGKCVSVAANSYNNMPSNNRLAVHRDDEDLLHPVQAAL